MGDKLRKRLSKYILPKEQWTPVDEALYEIHEYRKDIPLSDSCWNKKL
jgi:hypothetical protein